MVFICGIFLILTLIEVSTRYSIHVASAGGTFTEGIIGTPRFINPVLAVTRADKDLSALVYDGLMTLGKDGVLVPNIAESVTVSDDGLTYNVILKKNVMFSDGTSLTARDVAFTVGRIQDPLLASPLRANFDGITIEEVGEYELNFVLPEAYAPFIENLTFGIIPEHIWKEVNTDEFPFSSRNSEPVGSGPYAIDSIVRNASGIPETYILKANAPYHAGTPKIEAFEFHFFPTEEKLTAAFRAGIVGSVAGVDATQLAEYGIHEGTHHLERIPLPRTFAVFINQNKSPALRDSAARKALDVALDRPALIHATLGGYGNVLTTPIPTGFGIEQNLSTEDSAHGIEAARAILTNGGWKLNPEKQIWEKDIEGTLTPLAFSIATVNSTTFEETAEFLRATWQQLGVEVTVKQFEQSDLTQSVIRPRDYEALLFGTQLGRPLDFYSFWHSSQRNDPGLNIALYANITTDSILGEMRRSSNPEARSGALNRFAEEIEKETPAIFLYTPELLYIFPNTVQGASFKGVGEPQERFSGIHEWYTETESVWPFFAKTK
jgi:peptide/nickel transport system substrate-binding protein